MTSGSAINQAPMPLSGARETPRLGQVERANSGTRISIIDPLDDPAWESLIEAHPDATFFHGAAWAGVLSRTYGHKPLYLRCEKDGELAALIPLMEVRSRLTGRRGVTLPFTDFCAPLMYGNAAVDFVLGAIRQTARERCWDYFEIRDGKLLRGDAEPAITYFAHMVDLRGGPGQCFERMSGPARTAVRKAGQSGLAVEIRRDPAAMTLFYSLHSRTRRRHGAPPQPFSFFRNIQQEVVDRGKGFIALAIGNAKPVAAAVFFHLGSRAIFKFGASDERRQQLRANNLVMWTAIDFLAGHGFDSLHLGRTSLENDGLRRFKSSFGATEEKLDYYKFSMAAGSWTRGSDKSSGWHARLFRALPEPVNRLAGAILYPHLD